jgi:ArsR family transcriptional regulator, arsenate/arsenite/antimonite-responsive transcriptional repressor
MDVRTITRCCEPVLSAPLDEADADELAAAFRVLADPARLRLLSLVANAPDGEVCGCDLVAPLGRSQPTISHHLSVLVDAGLLARDKRGKWAWYSVVPEKLAVLCQILAPGAAISGASISGASISGASISGASI